MDTKDQKEDNSLNLIHDILDQWNSGSYTERLDINSVSPELMPLAQKLNQLGDNLTGKQDSAPEIDTTLDELTRVMISFSRLDFSVRVNSKPKNETLRALGVSLNMLGEELERNYNESRRYQLMLLGSQINPHFIFNALNSIQYFILEKNTEPAISFVSGFANLMRSVLQFATQSLISLEEELQLLQGYLDLEKIRFEDRIDSKIELDDSISLSDILIPPMLIQLYVENAIIHGLAPSLQKGILVIKITQKQNSIECIIDDNGIGRKKGRELQKLRSSEADQKDIKSGAAEMKLHHLNKLHGGFQVTTVDKLDKDDNPIGTTVTIKFPDNLS